MLKSTIMGDKIDLNNKFNEKLYLSVIPKNILSYWSKASDVANFIADFYHYDFSNKAVHNNISTVLNELIENAVKFSSIKEHKIDIYSYNNSRELIFQITNSISMESWNKLKKVHEEMESTDLKKLYVKRIHDLSTSKSGTGIGLLLLKKDYGIDINFSLEENREAEDLLTTTVKMKVA